MVEKCDYVVSAVTYGHSHRGKHITHLEVRTWRNGRPGPACLLNRHEVKRKIEGGWVFKTISNANQSGEWEPGRSCVQVVSKNGDFYLKTTPDGVPFDNLSKLLTYEPGEFVVSAVTYRRGRISELEVHPCYGKTLRPCFRLTRDQVVELIMDGSVFRTTYQLEDGSWEMGPEVRIVRKGEGYWLRTDPNEGDEDNLGALLAYRR